MGRIDSCLEAGVSLVNVCHERFVTARRSIAIFVFMTKKQATYHYIMRILTMCGEHDDNGQRLLEWYIVELFGLWYLNFRLGVLASNTLPFDSVQTTLHPTFQISKAHFVVECKYTVSIYWLNLQITHRLYSLGERHSFLWYMSFKFH